jgi:hypothetical protein
VRPYLHVKKRVLGKRAVLCSINCVLTITRARYAERSNPIGRRDRHKRPSVGAILWARGWFRIRAVVRCAGGNYLIRNIILV